jgi:predicted Rossmann fold nucleotide-binding protein DprA/Smf involved in DNA uptake
LISGLCQGTLVVEGPEGSGALITAERALSQGRDLFAVPANIGDPNASGVNRLIRDGARVALCADDILGQYSLLYRHSTKPTASASLGKRSDYDGEMIARMGVFSRTVDGHERVSAAKDLLVSAAPSTTAVPTSTPKKQVEKKNSTSKKAATASASEPKAEVEPKACKPDHSAQILESLGERERRVFEAIPVDSPLPLDRLHSLGYSAGELLAALSLLEIRGLIQTLPGGLYCRA